jgi:LETM1 and EF-hand domain-containing protein 1, mitochondrial
MSLWLPRTSPTSLIRAHSRFPPYAPSLLVTFALRSNTAQLSAIPPLRRWQTSAANSPSSSAGVGATNTTATLSRSNSQSNPNDEKPIPASIKASQPVAKASVPTRVWKKVKQEAAHYWHGSKLLVSEVRISTRLQWKILHGESLTRRERRQVRLCICNVTFACHTLTIPLINFS